jgi:hypothetical protein
MAKRAVGADKEDQKAKLEVTFYFLHGPTLFNK